MPQGPRSAFEKPTQMRRHERSDDHRQFVAQNAVDLDVPTRLIRVAAALNSLEIHADYGVDRPDW